MHIQGTAYTAAYGSTVGEDTTTWTWATNGVDVTVEGDDRTPIGTATLSLDASNNLTVDAQIQDQYRRWTAIRPYLWPTLSGGSPQAVTVIGLYTTVPDPDLPAWTEVTP